MAYNEYPFLQSSDELASYLQNMTSKMGNYITASGLLERVSRAYNYYYGRYFRNNDGSRLGVAGEQGEFMTLSANHLRNIINHLLSIVTQNRLSFDCQAINTEVSSRNACIIGNQLLEQLFYEHNISHEIYRAVELGLAMGTSYLTVEWDQYGKLVGADEDGSPVYTGKLRVRSHSIFDVVCNPWKDDDQEQQWYQIREKANKWDLIALYPEKEKEILSLPRIADIQLYDPFFKSDDDHVWIYKVYHKESPALPNGRMMIHCDNGVILFDDVNPYVHDTDQSPNGGCPVFCFRPAIRYASFAGYTIAFDLMPLQEAMNILDSSIITNQQNYAVQNIAVPKASGVVTTELANGNRLIEYDHIEGVPGGGKPEPLQLCNTPAEVFNYRANLQAQFELLSGVNAVLRGQPQASLISGTALALVATQANSFNTTLEANYTRLCESVAHFALYVVSRFQRTEELVALVGKGKSNEIRTFKGDELSPIRKVKVTIGNSLARSTAGKLEIAEKLLNAGLIKTPQEFLEVLQSGNLTGAIETETAEIGYIKWENEACIRGELVHVLGTDNHLLHIREHRALTFNPQIRNAPSAYVQLLQHITDHLDQFDLMAENNPTLLNICMDQPVPLPVPSPGTGVGPGAQPPLPPQNNMQDISKIGVAKLTEEQQAGENPQGAAMQAMQSAATKLQQMGEK